MDDKRCYRIFDPSLLKKEVQNWLRNLGSRSVINSPDRPSTRSSQSNGASAQSFADLVSFPAIRATPLEYLYVTNIIALKPSAVTGSAKIKSNVSV